MASDLQEKRNKALQAGYSPEEIDAYERKNGLSAGEVKPQGIHKLSNFVFGTGGGTALNNMSGGLSLRLTEKTSNENTAKLEELIRGNLKRAQEAQTPEQKQLFLDLAKQNQETLNKIRGTREQGAEQTFGRTLKDVKEDNSSYIKQGAQLAAGVGGWLAPAGGKGVTQLAGRGLVGGGLMGASEKAADIPEAAKNIVTGAALGAGFGVAGGALSKAGSAITGKALEKIPARSVVTPGRFKAAIDKAKTPSGQALSDLLKASSESGKKINVNPIFEDLYKLRTQVVEEGQEGAIKQVDKVIDFLEKNTEMGVQGRFVSPSKAQAVKYGLDKNIYGEAGKMLKTRGSTGIGKKKATEKVANKLRELIRKEVEGAEPLYKEYETLSKLSREMENPLKNWWLGGLIGTLGGGFAGGAAGTLAAMPYTRNALRKFLGGTLQAVSKPTPYGYQLFKNTKGGTQDEQ